MQKWQRTKIREHPNRLCENQSGDLIAPNTPSMDHHLSERHILPPHPGKDDMTCFGKWGLRTSKGTTNPLEVERWLQRTERIFEMMYYTLEEKLDYTISLLQEDAYDWWVTVPNSRV